MEDLLTLIKTRQSSRGLFDTNRSISKAELNKILEAARWAPTAHNMQNFEIIAVDDPQIIETIANIELTMPKGANEEGSDYVSASEEELQRKKTGILNSLPGSITEHFKNPVFEYLRKSITASSVFLIVMYDPRKRAPRSEGDLLGKISLGCVMENMWLMAHALGIAMQIVTAVDYSDEYERQLKETLGIPAYFMRAYSCRLGYPVATKENYLRVRRDPEDFTHYNHWNNFKGV
ncbi:MAG: nitroreductase family protein [Firmicutes bacterium]|nr:nitroreductase family protein [Bacillota bacterium]